MNFPTVVVLVILTFAVAAAIRSILRQRRSGCAGCHGCRYYENCDGRMADSSRKICGCREADGDAMTGNPMPQQKTASDCHRERKKTI